jgi:hypothetical protein
MKMMSNIKYADLEYTVSAYRNFTLTEALRLWKSKYPEFVDFKKDVIKHNSHEDFGIFVHSVWDTITPVTVDEAFKETNLERRRVFFDCIGIRRIFSELNPEMLDRQVITKKRTKWDEDNNQEEYIFEDVYELYKIPVQKINPDNIDADVSVSWTTRRLFKDDDIYAVRCWCTTTNREYWIYVPKMACDPSFVNHRGNTFKPDAISAIAWTIRINIDKPERIYRQGDIIVVKVGEESKRTWPRHLTKDQYLELMYSET